MAREKKEASSASSQKSSSSKNEQTGSQATGSQTTGSQTIVTAGATPTSVTSLGGNALDGSSTSSSGMAGAMMPGAMIPSASGRAPEVDANTLVMSNAQVSVKALLDAGAHFGHQTQRWNPKMSPFIFGERNGIHIINLDGTVKLWERARRFVSETVAAGGSILFVGTKQSCADIVREEATRCGAFFVTDRWLGGTLSNFTTIRSAIERMGKLEELVKSAEQENSKVRLVKKERVRIYKELEKLTKSLGGIRDMRKLPQVIFIVDLVKEEIAVNEARKLNIPVVGIADSNCDPTRISFPIPSNDDAPKVVRLFTAALADAVIEGRRVAQSHGLSFGSAGVDYARASAARRDNEKGGPRGGGRRSAGGGGSGGGSRGGRFGGEGRSGRTGSGNSSSEANTTAESTATESAPAAS